MQLSGKNRQAPDSLRADDDMIYDGSENTTGTTDGNTEGKAGKVKPKEAEENDDMTRYTVKIAIEDVQESTSDEGWQEANSKARSAKTTGRKFGWRRPVPERLNVNAAECSNIKEGIYRRELVSWVQNATPKTISTELPPLKQPKATSLSFGEGLINLKAKVSVSKVSSISGSLTSLASKSLSYKEVALAPPGTIRKPILEKREGLNEEETEIQMSNIPHETSKDEENSNSFAVEATSKEVEIEGTHEESTQMEHNSPKPEEVSCSSDQVKLIETNGSKLSAAAEPFNPGSLSIHHQLNSGSLTSVYDVNISQGMLAEPVLTPVAARIPCGPRLPLYHRTNFSFRMKHGFIKYHNPTKERSGFGAPRIMNPHAPEFVPGRAWQATGEANTTVLNESNSVLETNRAEEKQLDDKSNKEVKDGTLKKSFSESEKSELARQILLSFIVKSVQHNMDPVGEPVACARNLECSENSSDAIANDRAIIKILYRSQGKEVVSQSSDDERPKSVDVNKKKNGDGEGFIVVTKRRRNRQQFTNDVSGLYNQQSICASVR